MGNVAHPRLTLVRGRITGQSGAMGDSLKDRVRQKLQRQLAEDGPDPEHDDARAISVADDLEALEMVQADDPLIEELAQRYLVF
jgi:hypothetical protein